MHQQLLVLKEENHKLKDMASKVQMVEHLKQENKSLRLELQQIKIQGHSDAFRQIGFTPGLLDQSTDQGKPLALMSEQQNMENSGYLQRKKDGGFFMTQTDDFADHQGNNRSSPLNSAMMSNQMPGGQINTERQLLNAFQKTNSSIGQGHMGQAGGPNTQSEHDKRITEIKQKAANMRGSLANNGRCPICTLKPPCKHFDSTEALGGAGHNQDTPVQKQQNLEFYPNKVEYSASMISNSHAAQSEQPKFQKSDGFSVGSNQTYSQGGGVFQSSA